MFDDAQYSQAIEDFLKRAEQAQESLQPGSSEDVDRICELLRTAQNMMIYDRELGIYNLNYFMRTANLLIEQEKIGDFGVCYFNLRGFSGINEQYGRECGTMIMKKYVTQLAEDFQEDEMVCRIGGDNFIVLFLKSRLEKVKDYLAATAVTFGEKEEDTVVIKTSAGYYMVAKDCKSAADIMDFVSMAASEARESVETSYVVFFDDKLVEESRNRRRIEREFVKALKKEEFKVYYQPKVDLNNYLLTGAEALCRWEHNGEIISPGEFIPILERSQAICRLDFYMLEHVCRDIRRWIDEGRKVVKVSINLSRRHMGNEYLLEQMLEIIDRNGVPHEYIQIELTETTTDVDFQLLKQLVVGLGENGIETSVDDFGTGYSSLNLLREAPWSVIKIDKSFLPADENGDEKQLAMLKHLIALSKDMGVQCIVEGVETLEQLNLLKSNNCFMAQGFYFDKPLKVDEFEKRLEAIDKPL